MFDVDELLREVLSARNKPSLIVRLVGWLMRVWTELHDSSEVVHRERQCLVCEHPEPCTLWWLPNMSQIAGLLMPIVLLFVAVRAALGCDDKRVKPTHGRIRH